MQGLVWNDLNFGGEITALSDTFTFQKIMKNKPILSILQVIDL